MTHEITDFSMNMFSLKGKTAIVTGANQNLGMAYAVAFAKAGADLYIPHFTDLNKIISINKSYIISFCRFNPFISCR